MDKFEMEQFGAIRDVVADLQTCFIDGDAYSRSPSANEWRRATALAHRLTLLCFELYGYASATRQYNVVSIRERLHVVSNEGGEENKNPDVVGTPGNATEILKFTTQEISKSDMTFKKVFIANGLIATLSDAKAVRGRFITKSATVRTGTISPLARLISERRRKSFCLRRRPGKLKSTALRRKRN